MSEALDRVSLVERGKVRRSDRRLSSDDLRLVMPLDFDTASRRCEPSERRLVKQQESAKQLPWSTRKCEGSTQSRLAT
jgi:hypothetical protein